VLDTLRKLESMFPIVNASAKPQPHELNDLVKTLVNNSQKILKANWDRVREGEDGYRTAKSRAVIAFWVFLAAAVILSIGYSLYKLNLICG
jgi:hypothetical protein